MLRTISALVKSSLQGQLVLVSKQSFATKFTSMVLFPFFLLALLFLFLLLPASPTPLHMQTGTERHRDTDRETQRQRDRMLRELLN